MKSRVLFRYTASNYTIQRNSYEKVTEMEILQQKILVTEDEPFLRKSIKELLVKNGYEVYTASCKEEAMQYVLTDKKIELYLIDLFLPDGDGFEICEQLRKRSIAPIIFLTACDDEESVVKGLNMGADDYITKPFRTAELLSRIRANLRRRNMEVKNDVLQSEEICLDIIQQRAFKNDEELCLTPIEYQLLHTLMSHAGMIIKREVFLEKLWDVSGKFVQDNTLSVAISRLRNKVGIEYIETVHGFGYRFTKPVYGIKK